MNGAKDNVWVFIAHHGVAGTRLKKFVPWSHNAAGAEPNIIEGWRHDAVMHVARNEDIKILQEGLNVFVSEVNRGVVEEDIGLIFAWLMELCFWGLAEIMQEDILVFLLRIEN